MIFLLGCVLSGPVWAGDEADASVAAEATTPEAQTHLDEEPKETGTQPYRVRAETPYWDFDYHRGLRTSRTGTKMGTVGLFSILGGLSLFAVGMSTNEGSLEVDSGGALAVSGFAVAMLGVITVQVGAPVAALGTASSHRALVQGGQTDRGCGACLVAVALSIPNPISLLTVPWSYTVSSEQRRHDKIRYHRYKGWPPPVVKVSRMGLGLSGQF